MLAHRLVERLNEWTDGSVLLWPSKNMTLVAIFRTFYHSIRASCGTMLISSDEAEADGHGDRCFEFWQCGIFLEMAWYL